MQLDVDDILQLASAQLAGIPGQDGRGPQPTQQAAAATTAANLSSGDSYWTQVIIVGK